MVNGGLEIQQYVIPELGNHGRIDPYSILESLCEWSRFIGFGNQNIFFIRFLINFFLYHNLRNKNPGFLLYR